MVRVKKSIKGTVQDSHSHMNVLLHSTVASCTSKVKLSCKDEDELEKLVFKLLQLSDGKFEDCYELEHLNASKEWEALFSFKDVKDGMDIRVISKAFSKPVDLPSNTEELHEYLGVRVIQAVGMEGKKAIKLADPFVVLYFSKAKANKWKTVARKDTPSWNENFILPLPGEIISEEGKIMDSLTVRLFSSPKGSDQLVGKGTIPLSHLKKSERQNFAVDLKSTKVELEVSWFEDIRITEPISTSSKFRSSMMCCAAFVPPPPRDSIGKSHKEKELRWFNQLPVVNPKQLQKGDIIIKKAYNQACPVKIEQKAFYASRGTKYSTQLGLVCDDGGGVIYESSASFKVLPKFPEFDFVAYRPFDTVYAKESVNWATDIAKNHDLKFSMKNCIGSANPEYNANSKQRSKKLVAKELPTDMMCSEFVCAAYQCRPDDPKIKMDSQRVIPMRFEDYLNKHPEDWILLGKICSKDATSFNAEYVAPRLTS